MFFFFWFFSLAAHAESTRLPQNQSAKIGAGIYRSCFYCHSLQPGVHLTGPSLAEIWGKKAGQAAGFELYSDNLKKSALVWDEATLRRWIVEPSAVVPGTTMTHSGPKDAQSMNHLMEFLRIALAPDGFKKTQELGLLDAQVAGGQLPKDLSRAQAKDRVTGIFHCGNIYTITTADGRKTRHWEMNIDFKSNSSGRGPPAKHPVLQPAGSMGDRFAIVFHDPQEIGKSVRRCEQKKTPNPK